MTRSRKRVSRAAVALLCLPLWLPFAAEAASDQEIEELRRSIQELKARNDALSKRLSTLEAERSARKPAAQAQIPSPPSTRAEVPPPVTPPAAQPPGRTTAQTAPPASTNPDLEQRVTELEISKRAQEDAVRSIIQDSLSKVGPKINEFVTLGGAIEVVGGRQSDFSGTKSDQITLSTAELDLEIKVNDWMLGNLILSYDSGTNVLFPTTSGINVGVDRFTVDRATVLIGDVQRFPLYMKVGRDVVPFGTSTGVSRNDILSITNPLTIEAFETRRNQVGIGFALPTPEPGPPPPPVVVPPVQPMVLNPMVGWFGRTLGYVPPPFRRRPPGAVSPPPEPPPFYGELFAYDANSEGINRRFSGNLNGRLGYQTRGHCGRPYSELTDSWICPWAFDFAVDYIGSVFDSNFLSSEYGIFLPQIGKVPGMAAHIKSSFGPFSLIAEWNGALTPARFIDDAGRRVSIVPAAWQVSLGYQFRWNPWVETIGAQGTYIAATYSRSHGLAGVTSLGTGSPTRVGFVPESRLTLTAAEWVLEGARVLLEYSHNWDYPRSKGGTGRQADGVFLALTYVW